MLPNVRKKRLPSAAGWPAEGKGIGDLGAAGDEDLLLIVLSRAPCQFLWGVQER
jgi:hypothetical protein